MPKYGFKWGAFGTDYVGGADERGYFEFTLDPAKAITFETLQDALDWLQRQALVYGASRPVRPVKFTPTECLAAEEVK